MSGWFGGRVGGKPRVMCDHCGSNDHCSTLHVGVQPWQTCRRCRTVIETWERTGEVPSLVFGLPLPKLPRPLTTAPAWIAYRMAAQECGYTLYMADTRAQRDHLHDRWGRWMGHGLALRREAGLVPDRPKQSYFVGPYLMYLEEQYGAPSRDAERDAWLLQEIAGRVLRSEDERRIMATIPPRRGGRHGLTGPTA